MSGVHGQSGAGLVEAERMDPRVVAALREKTPAERIAIADEMWHSVRGMLERLIASEHEDWSAERVRREASARLSHGAV